VICQQKSQVKTTSFEPETGAMRGWKGSAVPVGHFCSDSVMGMFLLTPLNAMLNPLAYFAGDPPAVKLVALFLILLAVVAVSYIWLNSKHPPPKSPSKKSRS